MGIGTGSGGGDHLSLATCLFPAAIGCASRVPGGPPDVSGQWSGRLLLRDNESSNRSAPTKARKRVQVRPLVSHSNFAPGRNQSQPTANRQTSHPARPNADLNQARPHLGHLNNAAKRLHRHRPRRRSAASNFLPAAWPRPPPYLIIAIIVVFLINLLSLSCYCQSRGAAGDIGGELRDAPASAAQHKLARTSPDLSVRAELAVGNATARRRARWQRRRALGEELQAEQQRNTAHDVVPYKTYYVTQACEWKSNLFVPHSNDIHFALERGQQRDAALGQHADAADQLQGGGLTRTILSTSQKALVLALPLALDHSFAGYEPACSIRLIVPRNMRILAKLTTRRLTFEQQQVQPPPWLGPAAITPIGSQAQAALTAEQLASAARGQLWLNVSQNQFSETEEKTIETEGNVLAFRFLLERFANRQAPEIRFQVVLTAFQTFGENSDFNQPANSVAVWPPAASAPHADGSQQFICDGQRLISANLACDGYKNCQDGHDEESATCLALRQQQAQGAATLPPLAADDERLLAGGGARGQQRPARVLDYFAREAGWTVVGLLLLPLLCCCVAAAFCMQPLRRRLSGLRASGGPQQAGSSSAARRRLQRRLAALKQLARAPGGAQMASPRGRAAEAAEDESDALARGQNLENAARQKMRTGLLEQQRQQQQRRIQSILKRPPQPADLKGVAPLALFEAIQPQRQAQHLPPPPPPRGQLRSGIAVQQHQQLSPRRGALASSLTNTRSSGRFASALAAAGNEFRPTPAARATVAAAKTSPSGQPRTGAAVLEDDGLQFKSMTSKLEQTSTSTGTEHVTVYQYSSNVAQYSESYLLRQRLGREAGDERSESPQQRHQPHEFQSAAPTEVGVAGSAAASPPPRSQQPPELPPKSRQSSLI